MRKYILFCTFIIISHFQSIAQQSTSAKGKIFDAITKEPIAGALIYASPTNKTISKENGVFILSAPGNSISIEAKGYEAKKTIKLSAEGNDIELVPTQNLLEQVVVSSNRTSEKRCEAPIAIASISKQLLAVTLAKSNDLKITKKCEVFTT